MNILITGIHGFVGSNLVVALKNHYILYGLDIVTPEKEGVVKTFVWKDVETTSFPIQKLPQFDAIIHLAGKAHDTKNQSASQVYFDINTGLTQKIFDFFLESSAKRFIFFSSVKAAAVSVVGDMLTEDVIPTPVGPYGESKIAAESYIKEHFILPTTSPYGYSSSDGGGEFKILPTDILSPLNYHLTKTYNFNEQACLETSSPAHQHRTIKWLFSRQHLRYADCTVERAIL